MLKMKKLRRFISGMLIVAIVIGILPLIPSSIAMAEEEKFPYTIFAGEPNGGITINSTGLTVNGDIYSNGNFSSLSEYFNMNGEIYANNINKEIIDADLPGGPGNAVTGSAITYIDSDETEVDFNKEMIYLHGKLMYTYFDSDTSVYNNDYTHSDMNMNINKPIYSFEELHLSNLSLNKRIGAVSNVNISEET